MTAPLTPEALVERKALRKAILAAIPENVPLRGRFASAIMEQAVSPLLAALQQVMAERDEARAKQSVPLTEEQLETRRSRAHQSIVRRLQSERDTATGEAARLRAEVEAKDRRIAVLEAALEPFAWFGEVATPDTAITWSGVRHTERISTRFRHEQFRAARTALARAATAREGQADE